MIAPNSMARTSRPLAFVSVKTSIWVPSGMVPKDARVTPVSRGGERNGKGKGCREGVNTHGRGLGPSIVIS